MPEPQEKQLVVVAVDDEPDNLRLIERALRPKHDVTSFESPEKALEAMRGRVVDLLITDFKMPGLSGVQLAERVQNLENPTPVVIMSSAYADTQEVLDAHRSGILDIILLKPWKLSDLTNSVRRATVLQELRRRKAMS